MANPNPVNARLGKKKASKPGNLKEVAGMLWEALETARELLSDDDTGTRLKAIHALSQTASSYARVYEVGELEARLEALEQAMQGQQKGAA
ncbi:hypothetical protein [Deinococcus fonticola]|uniref:hypothetical protein n=1 Tax=Deinococcus fonticola TaxID=2528713 RepID=UPI001074EC58|nr:hypothetical protein [Deinococcus fonticola]